MGADLRRFLFSAGEGDERRLPGMDADFAGGFLILVYRREGAAVLVGLAIRIWGRRKKVRKLDLVLAAVVLLSMFG